MNRELEELYFNWLCAKLTVNDRVPHRTYNELFRVLHNTEFVFLMMGDQNRAEDGIELRDEFLYTSNRDSDHDWASVMCSVFEMLIAFSRRCEFNTDIPAHIWFWEFINNLGLGEWDDDRPAHEYAIEVLYHFVNRVYEPDGTGGGLFPLKEAHDDQRKVEIYYQFFAYLEDSPERFRP